MAETCAGITDGMSPEERLRALDIELPPVPVAAGNYVHAVEAGGLLFLSGKGLMTEPGRVGENLSPEQACDHARRTGLILLSVMREALGSLDRVERVVKVLGMVNAAPDFGDHPTVINGCSDLLVEVLGERGKHARSVFGTGSLPGCAAVAIEAIVEVAAED